jgi:hypothetical protein
VHRRERLIHHDTLEPLGHALLEALARGEPLGIACTTTAERASVSVETLGEQLAGWFADWSRRGYVVDVLVGAG